ncbi:MAG: hypothetical protein NZL89_03160, partial [Leptospiraceae bacterium]|nr:hypothetical protein [Leptospiraceae bacterium]
MPQTAADPAQHTYQRKAAIATGRVADHTEKVEVKPIRDFDLGRTIFNTLEGAIPRLFITARIAKEVHWQPDAAQAVEEQYQKKRKEKTPPPIDPKLVSFMRDECNFNMEHADGSFLDHLFFCYEYTFYHYPRHSPLVMFLHSILGTATN